MFVNDLVRDIKSSSKGINLGEVNITSLLYADYVVVLADKVKELQATLDSVYSWCKKWGIDINPTKTQAMHFRNKRKNITPCSLHLGNNVVELCHEYKYLGFWINVMNESIHKVFDRANKALGVIIAKSKELGGFPFTVFTKLYEVSTLSVFNYTAHIWSFNRSVPTLPKKIQNRFFFGLGKAAPIAALLGDSGWPPIEIYLQFKLLKYWFRLGNMSMDRIPKMVYK